MAAKKPAAKYKPVKNSKTIKSVSGFTARQRQTYNAVYYNALRSSVRQARVNRIMAQRVQAAATRARGRQRAIVRTQVKILRGRYVQARYGTNPGMPNVPLKSQLRKVQSITAYLQARYGKKTYAITGKGSVRLNSKKSLGPAIMAAAKPAVRKAQTSRTPYANAYARAYATQAARRISPKAKVSKTRKAPRHLKALPDTPWITAGNDEGIENCVAVAIANSLLYNFGYRVTDEQLELVKDNKLNRALWRIWHDEPWWPVDLLGYRWTDEPEPGDIIGFESENGPHCGVLLPGNKVVSWGEVIPLESEIEEAWTLKWAMTG